MIFAQTQQVSAGQVALAAWLIAGTLAGLIVFGRVLGGIRREGVQTRPDLLGSTDMLVALALLMIPLLGLATHLAKLGAAEAPTAEAVKLPTNLIGPMIWQILQPAAVILMMVARDMSPVDLFGLRRVGIVRALLLGLGFAMVALPLTMAAKQITMTLVQSEDSQQQQMMVQFFKGAVDRGDWMWILQIAISATLLAPVGEEILFRGYFYPVVSRGFGRVTAAVLIAVVFGAAHDVATDIPGLALLALCLTVVYERTGSLLVPIFTHVWFNGITLLVLWLNVRYGIMP